MMGETIRIWKEGGMILVRSDKRHINTEGRTLREALLHFHEAYLLDVETGAEDVFAPPLKSAARRAGRYGKKAPRSISPSAD